MSNQNLQTEGTDVRIGGGVDQTFVGVDIVPVTPNDSVDLPSHARAIRATVGGTLRITTYKGVVRNTNIVAGEILPVYARRVHAGGTTATGIEAIL